MKKRYIYRKSHILKLLKIFLCLAMIAPVFGYSKDLTFEKHAAPNIPDKVKIAFIGNSVTLHPPKNNIGWKNNNGMAASGRNKDYAHKTLVALNINEAESYVVNFYPFESQPNIAKYQIASLRYLFQKKPKIVVIQLGDNVSINYKHPINSLYQVYFFQKNYSNLVAKARYDSKNVFCLSTWWESKIKDYYIKKSCEQNGANFVFIGDILKSPNNVDIKTVDFKSKEVDSHPKDWAMNQISIRLKDEIVKFSMRTP